VSQAEAAAIARRERRRGRVVVFTNGCFDILHVGHLSLLERSRAMGDTLVVGVNTDPSVRRLKGPGRPIVPLAERMEMLAALRVVDLVVPFGAPTPARLIARLVPDVLIKGRDYRRETIVGRATVEEAGGKVITLPLLRTLSTSNLVRRALRSGRRALRRAR
jgi:D-beta-D-heptose 7-phosphate kinase/D-beta-D-heptose 1-phosphate adenosyltransferase